MSSAPVRFGPLAVTFMVMCARGAGAQPVASSLDDLKILEWTGSKVTVTDTNGQKYRGTVAGASDSLLSLRTGSAIRRFSVGEVRSVQVRKEDSLGNGVLIGA